ncbi:MAG: hypothetical protein JWP95_728 [Actinotalea sp.]|nr:hypothetical protein [Actinotalea sp.]
MDNARNLLGGPAPTLLPEDPAEDAARAAVAGGGSLQDAARLAPASSVVWAQLAEQTLTTDPVAAYAYARTGYHRGLDALRRAGWRGSGPVPASHVPNQGFLRSLLALAQAAEAIDDDVEAQRCRTFLADCGTSEEELAATR